MNEDIPALLAQRGRSRFRSSFALLGKDRAYLETKGLTAVLDYAADFIIERLAPAAPANDGKQTPFRGHPVFVAQHATATCCRSCLEKWHGVEKGQELTDDEQAYVVRVIESWLLTQASDRDKDGADEV